MTSVFVESAPRGGHGVDGIASLAALEAEHGPLPDTLKFVTPTGSVHNIFKQPGFKIKTFARLVPGVDVKGDGGMFLAPPSNKPGKGVYKWLNNLPIADAPQWLLDLVKTKLVERSTITGPVPNAVGGVSHDGVSYEELCWWIARKVERWESGVDTLSNDEWLSWGKRIKLSFPGEDGLQALLAMSYADQHDAITRRWWNPGDFKTEGENLQTLPPALRGDITWIFREMLSCPMAPKPSPRTDLPPPPPSAAPSEAEYDAATERRSLRDRLINAASLAASPCQSVNGWCPAGYRWSKLRCCTATVRSARA